MIGILLLNLGGPDSLDAVKPFLVNLFSDRDIIRLGPTFLQKTIAYLIASSRAKKTRRAYGKIGGMSPLLAITNAQAKCLEEYLNSQVLEQSPGHDDNPILSKRETGGFKVYVGMRYWHPLIEEVLDKMHRAGVKRIFALSLYPQYSLATSGSSIKKLKDAAAGYAMEYFCLNSWFDHPIYIDALVKKIQYGMASFAAKPSVLFSAHSLPKRFIDEGDPYVAEIKGTINEIVKRIEMEWYLSYQSKTGPVKWLEPSTETMLHDLSKQGIKNLLVVPISFVSDHIETLYEIDILYRDLALQLGINLKRMESLNTSPDFISALADIVIKNIIYLKWL
ncbi:MAG: ferrochelatase [Dissulfurispiraceae bacterium]